MTPENTNPSPDRAPHEDTDATLAAWWDDLCTALGLGAVPIEPEALLALAGDAAHGIVRPAAPLTTFLVGYAAGRQRGDRAALEEAVSTVAGAIRERSRA